MSASAHHTVTTFGSAIITARPDRAQLTFRVTHTDDDPALAFAQVRRSGEAVRAVLDQLVPDAEVLPSNMTLLTATTGYGADLRVLGQQASISFTIITNELGKLEELLTALVHAGVNRIADVSFHSSRLAELRAQARRRAVANARAKAALYAEAAGAHLGHVLTIEDKRPQEVFGGVGHGAEMDVSAADSTEGEGHAPGSIAITAAVQLTFALLSPGA